MASPRKAQRVWTGGACYPRKAGAIPKGKSWHGKAPHMRAPKAEQPRVCVEMSRLYQMLNGVAGPLRLKSGNKVHVGKLAVTVRTSVSWQEHTLLGHGSCRAGGLAFRPLRCLAPLPLSGRMPLRPDVAPRRCTALCSAGVYCWATLKRLTCNDGAQVPRAAQLSVLKRFWSAR